MASAGPVRKQNRRAEGVAPPRGAAPTVPEGVPRRGKVGAAPRGGGVGWVPRWLRGVPKEGG